MFTVKATAKTRNNSQVINIDIDQITKTKIH